MSFRQPFMDVLRQMNNHLASQSMQSSQAPIPRPGQPSSYQIPPTGLTGNFSPEVAQYINQDIAGFNAQGGSTHGFQSEWDEINGRRIGDTYLPPDVSTVDLGKGWYEVHHGGQRVGTLRPGGKNGRFINDTNWQMPQPGLVGVPGDTPSAPPGGMPQQISQFRAAGPYGAQAMQMAGLLGQQPAGPSPGGLLGGPKRAFTIPGGK